MKRIRIPLAAALLVSFAVPAFADPCVPDPDGAGSICLAIAAANDAALTTAPGVPNFAKAWTKKFAGAIRSAAGIDGRLSVSEATKLSLREDSTGLFGDNALNFLKAEDQQSVDVEKLIRSGYGYAYANGKKVAGDDGRISFADAEKFPADLQADFLYLRGR